MRGGGAYVKEQVRWSVSRGDLWYLIALCNKDTGINLIYIHCKQDILLTKSEKMLVKILQIVMTNQSLLNNINII